MKTKNLKILAAAAFLASCSPIYYMPSVQNVPLISEKGEVNATLSAGSSVVAFDGAYGITDHFGIMAKGNIFYYPENSDDSLYDGSGNYFEFGGGYFTPVGENFVFETYGIVGLGKVNNHLVFGNTEGISSDIIVYGIQPAFGYKHKNFSATVSSRFTALNYNNITGDLLYQDKPQAAYLAQNNSHFLIEPALTLRGGTENVKLQVQYAYSINTTNSEFLQDKAKLSVGLSFNFKTK